MSPYPPLAVKGNNACQPVLRGQWGERWMRYKPSDYGKPDPLMSFANFRGEPLGFSLSEVVYFVVVLLGLKGFTPVPAPYTAET